MAKSTKSTKGTEGEDDAKPRAGTVEVEGVQYEVVEDVRVPNYRLPQDKPCALRILTPITSKQKKIKGEDGVERIGTIVTARVLDHATGETGEMVIGAALVSILKDYNGGNGAYVGCDFLVTKCKAPEGKRYKEYKVSRITVK